MVRPSAPDWARKQDGSGFPDFSYAAGCGILTGLTCWMADHPLIKGKFKPHEY
jgi:hypothetical protein